MSVFSLEGRHTAGGTKNSPRRELRAVVKGNHELILDGTDGPSDNTIDKG